MKPNQIDIALIELIRDLIALGQYDNALVEANQYLSHLRGETDAAD